MYLFTVSEAQEALTRFQNDLEAHPHEEIWDRSYQQFGNAYYRCLGLARIFKTRQSNAFLKKWDDDNERTEIITKLSYYGIRPEEQEAALEFVTDLTHMIVHAYEMMWGKNTPQ